MCRQKGKVIYFNHLAEEITGGTKDEAIGKDIYSVIEIFNANTKEPLKFPIEYVIDNDTATGLFRDTALISKSNVLRYISATCSPIKNNEKDIIGVVMIIRDITRLRTLEIEHINEKEHFMNLLNQLPALVWYTDKEMKNQYFNDSWTRLTGKKFESPFTDKNIGVVHPQEGDNLEIEIKKAMSMKKPFSMEMRILARDGNYRWFINIGQPYYEVDGGFAGYIGILYDITTSKQAKKTIFESQENYRSLFMNMSEGYANCKIEYDEKGIPKDLLFNEVNEAFEKMLGLSKSM